MKSIFLLSSIFTLLVGYGAMAGVNATPTPDSISSYPLAISEQYTTNLIFPFSIFQADLGNGNVIGKKMGRAENVLLLKANRAHFPPTNVSVYLVNGALYSFRVNYSDSLLVLNFSFKQETSSVGMTGRRDSSLVIFPKLQMDAQKMEEDAALLKKAPGFLSIKASDGKVMLSLKSIYIKDRLLWLGFKDRNRSLIDFQPGLLRFSLEDRKRTRRTAVQSINLEPVYMPASDRLTGGSKSSWVAGFSPFTITKGKKLVIEWSESDGSRRVRLIVKANRLLKARTYK